VQSKTLVALVIQARNSSTRFPFKIMKDLCGKNILERILERVKKVKLIDEIIVATTKREEDDIIVNIAKKNAVSYFRGSTNNLIDRYYKAVKDKKFSHILRLPSDNPIPDFEEFDRLIKYHVNSKNDFSSNICDFLNNGYPDGIGVEIYSLKTIKKIWELEKNKYNQEHITPCIYNYLKRKKNKKFNFKIGTIKCIKKKSQPNLVLDVNYLKDYIFIKKIYENLIKKKKFFKTEDIIKLLKKFKVHNKTIFELV
tara:strand:- start:794 stop:1555 length:762 start_codon:yes stop_codon:yes gene_type:complete